MIQILGEFREIDETYVVFVDAKGIFWQLSVKNAKLKKVDVQGWHKQKPAARNELDMAQEEN